MILSSTGVSDTMIPGTTIHITTIHSIMVMDPLITADFTAAGTGHTATGDAPITDGVITAIPGTIPVMTDTGAMIMHGETVINTIMAIVVHGSLTVLRASAGEVPFQPNQTECMHPTGHQEAQEMLSLLPVQTIMQLGLHQTVRQSPRRLPKTPGRARQIQEAARVPVITGRPLPLPVLR